MLLSTHADRQCGYIVYCLCGCLFFVQLQISPLRIKLAVSNFARRLIGVPGREFHILRNFAPPEAPNRTNWPALPCRNVMLIGFCHLHVYQVRMACGHRIDMCEYTPVPEDGHTCLKVNLYVISYNL